MLCYQIIRISLAEILILIFRLSPDVVRKSGITRNHLIFLSCFIFSWYSRMLLQRATLLGMPNTN